MRQGSAAPQALLTDAAGKQRLLSFAWQPGCWLSSFTDMFVYRPGFWWQPLAAARSMMRLPKICQAHSACPMGQSL